MRNRLGRIFSAVCLGALILCLAACGRHSSEDGNAIGGAESLAEGTNETGESSETVASSISDSLIWTGREELLFATEFSLDEYEGGYTLLQISDGSRFLIVPESAAVPSDLASDIVVLQQPMKNVYLAASAVMDMVQSIDAIENIRLSGTKEDAWYIEEAKRAMEEGEILYAGKYSEPDYELILSEGCALAIENTMLLHAPEVGEKLESLGIPVLIDYSSYEAEPMGRVEWVKAYGAIFGRTTEAEAVFEEQMAFVDEVVEEEISADEKKTVAFFYLTTDGNVNVRKSNDYVPKMIAMAGGQYIYEDLGEADNHSTSETVSFEAFYQTAVDADVLIYNSSIDGGVLSMADLLAKNELFSDFEAVQEGEVWCTTKNFYQESMAIGRFIKELNQVLTGVGGTEYIFRVE